MRQITFERDPAVSVGVPVWSPTGSDIVFILTRPGAPGLSLINRDGSGLRQFTSNGVFGNWSADGQWIYYAQTKGDTWCIHKAPLAGKPTTTLRCDGGVAPAPAPDGSALYFVKALTRTTDSDDEIHRARPENGPSEVIGRVAASRAPVGRGFLGPVLSPDGQLLAMPLRDATTGNIWALPTDGRPMRPVTDFGDRIGHHRPPGLVVPQQQIHLRGRGGHRRRHRPAGRPAPIGLPIAPSPRLGC